MKNECKYRKRSTKAFYCIHFFTVCLNIASLTCSYGSCAGYERLKMSLLWKTWQFNSSFVPLHGRRYKGEGKKRPWDGNIIVTLTHTHANANTDSRRCWPEYKRMDGYGFPLCCVLLAKPQCFCHWWVWSTCMCLCVYMCTSDHSAALTVRSPTVSPDRQTDHRAEW